MTEQQQAFRDFLGELVRRHGTPEKLARAMGIAPQSIYRAVKEQFTLSTENCLRLAEVSSEAPSHVLRLAGKSDMADLIERLYGKATVTAGERHLLETWRHLNPKRRDIFSRLMSEFEKESAEKHPARKTA